MNDLSSRLAEYARNQRRTSEYRQEELALDIAMHVNKRLKHLELTRSDLARRMGVSPAYVTQLLGGKPNMTLSTMVRLADALKLGLNVRFVETRNPKLQMYRAVIAVPNAFDSAIEVGSGEQCDTSADSPRQSETAAIDAVDSTCLSAIDSSRREVLSA